MSPATSPDPSTSSTELSHLSPETLESHLLAHLSNSNALEDLHTNLLCTLQRMGWIEKIRKLTAELLRAGRCERFDDVVDAVVATAEGKKHAALASNADANAADSETEAYFENVDVRIPAVVVEQGVKALKEVLSEVVVFEEEGEEEGHKEK